MTSVPACTRTMTLKQSPGDRVVDVVLVDATSGLSPLLVPPLLHAPRATNAQHVNAAARITPRVFEQGLWSMRRRFGC